MSSEPASTADTSRVVLLGQDGPSTRAVYHALAREFRDVAVVLEEPTSRMQLLRRRARKLGLVPVAGQMLFMAIAVPILRWRGRRRIDRIARGHRLRLAPIDGRVVHVPSVNSEEARSWLRRLRPDVVVVSGARIIGAETLAAVGAPFVNMHAGITPLYRGVHGGYWALVEGRPDLVGTTIHLIDQGVDTGRSLAQVFFPVTAEDCFTTYPYLHMAYGIPALVGVVRSALEGRLDGQGPPSDLPSRLRYHPTLWGYVAARVSKGAR